ncbi:MAG: DnaD domain protein [Anaerolineae bacterium]|nr:DnaD domain protein [Anaerolineae bacterium]MDW8098888.1 DnaD domain protein [Anaerolineae bacterium]
MGAQRMRGFTGFPAGKVRQTKLPDPFFTELLPIIDDLAELKLTLYCFWQLGRQQGSLRCLRRSDLERDEQLAKALGGVGGASATALADAIDRAVARGTLLRVYVQADNQPQEELLFMNTAHSREIVSRIQAGEMADLAGQVPAETAARLHAERPNIFNLYEQNIGVLQPLIAEELRDAERTYPPEWIEAAFREAVHLNKRSWRYVLAILKRWAAEGKGDEIAGRDSPEARRRRYIPDEYADLIEH